MLAKQNKTLKNKKKNKQNKTKKKSKEKKANTKQKQETENNNNNNNNNIKKNIHSHNVTLVFMSPLFLFYTSVQMSISALFSPRLTLYHPQTFGPQKPLIPPSNDCT